MFGGTSESDRVERSWLSREMRSSEVKYGGVWIDATILLLKPLDSVIKEPMPDRVVETGFSKDGSKGSVTEN